MTEWDEIKNTPLSMCAEWMRNPVIFNGRNVYTLEEAAAHIDYFPTGRPPSLKKAAS